MINLKRFCGVVKLPKDFRTPFTIGDFTYAGDKALMLRVPSKVYKVKAVNSNHVDPASVFKQFAKPPAGPYKTWPLWNGATVEARCGECVNIVSHGEDDKNGGCDFCGFRGYIKVHAKQRVNRLWISGFYHGLIAELPRVMYAVDAKADPKVPVYFRFEDGDGLIMPLNPLETMA